MSPETPTSDWFYRDDYGNEYGPYSRQEIEQYAREGRVSANGTVKKPTDDGGVWIPAAEAGLSFPDGARVSPPTSSGEAAQVAGHARPEQSPHARLTFILLGILLPVFVGIAGVNNLVVGRSNPGTVQLTLSIVALALNFIGAFVGVTCCIGIPLLMGVIIWAIIDAGTNTVDGQGRILS